MMAFIMKTQSLVNFVDNRYILIKGYSNHIDFLSSLKNNIDGPKQAWECAVSM